MKTFRQYIKEDAPLTWNQNAKAPRYKDAPTPYEFLKKNDYTYPEMDSYKNYTWAQWLKDVKAGTLPNAFDPKHIDTVQREMMFDYAFYKTGADNDAYRDWVKKYIVWNG